MILLLNTLIEQKWYIVWLARSAGRGIRHILSVIVQSVPPRALVATFSCCSVSYFPLRIVGAAVWAAVQQFLYLFYDLSVSLKSFLLCLTICNIFRASRASICYS